VEWRNERFGKINVRAQTAADVYANIDLSPQNNLDFLKRCVRWIPAINFADYKTGQIYARLLWRYQPRFNKARSKIPRQMVPCWPSLAMSTARQALSESVLTLR
jgi:hypothetical protein